MKLPKKSGGIGPFQFVDPLFILMMFLMLVIMSLIILPKKKEEAKSKVELIVGNLLITVMWPENEPHDIDLWVEDPNGDSVGYSRQTSNILSYLRDDLGNDYFSNLNYEFVSSQGIAAGRYVVNLHFYDAHEGKNKVPIEVEVILIRPNKSNQQIHQGKVELAKVGDEITVVQFELDNNGNVIYSTKSDEYVPVRNKANPGVLQ